MGYFPRCATEEELITAFVSAQVGVPCLASIMHDEKGASKCFGFTSFSLHEEARTAMQACADGRIVMRDHAQKVWHVKANWTQVEAKDGKNAYLRRVQSA